MGRQIKLTFTVGDFDDASARYVTASFGGSTAKRLGNTDPVAR